MLKKENKKKIIEEFAQSENDKGSAPVQIGILTSEIKELMKHLKTNAHDFSSKYGLLKKVSRRRKLLKYLSTSNPKVYKQIIKKI